VANGKRGSSVRWDGMDNIVKGPLVGYIDVSKPNPSPGTPYNYGDFSLLI